MDPNQQNIHEDQLQLVYNWVDEIPLSKPKKNISRDFADGGLIIISLCSRNSETFYS